MSEYGANRRRKMADIQKDNWKPLNRRNEPSDFWRSFQVAAVLAIAAYLCSHFLYFWWSR